MTWEAGSTDHQRLRAGYAVLSIGMAMILTGGCLLTVLIISVFAFIRMRRRFRDHLFAPPRKKTHVADIWRMHKVPDIPDESDEAENP